MKIGIDCRTALARKTGDRTYTLTLLHGLARLRLDHAVWEFHLLLSEPDDGQVLPHASCFKPVVLRAPNSRLWTMGAVPIYTHRARLDLLHVQYLAPPVLSCPFVTTIHDVVWRAMPETFPPLHRTIMTRAMPRTARRAARIICGSESARQDIAKYLGVGVRQINVTPYSIEPRYQQTMTSAGVDAVRARYELGDRPYVLSVGVLQPRKNLARLSEAFTQLKAAHPDWPHRLVIAGKRGWEGKDSSLIPHPSSLTTGYVPDEDLPALYRGAQVFTYPSLYEGFGLPIVEAMACGCPVLTSDISSMPEVAGDAACLVDPFSVESIRDGLERVLSDDGLRDNLRRRGAVRAAHFTPERQATATLEVYRQAVSARGH